VYLEGTLSSWISLIEEKMVPCRFSLNLSLFGFGPSSKGHGLNLWLSANRIALFHWTLELGPSCEVALKSKQKNSPIPTPCDLCMFRFMIILTSCSKRVKAQGLGHSQNMRLTVGVPYFGNDPTLGPYPTLTVLLQVSKFNSVIPTIISLPLA
jgi:hypothetical protein